GRSDAAAGSGRDVDPAANGHAARWSERHAARSDRDAAWADQRARCAVAAELRGEDAARERPYHEQQHHDAEQHHDQLLDHLHHIILGEAQKTHPALGLGDRRHWSVGKAQIGDLDLVTALLIEADGGAHQSGDPVDLLLAARLVGLLALVVLAVDAIDYDSDRHAIDPAALDHLGLGGARNLVI